MSDGTGLLAPARVATPLRRFVYRSRAQEPMATARLEALLIEARSRNRATGIGGVLVHAEGAFLQVVEGRPDRVEHLTRALARDPRHGALDILSDGPAGRRDFAERDMALAGPRPAPADLPLDGDALAALGHAPERLPSLLSHLTRHAAGATAREWVPEVDTNLQAEALLRLVIDGNAWPDPARIDGWLTEQAPGFAACVAVLEATATAAGRAWRHSRCTGAHVALTLAVLQGALARRRALVPMRPRLRKRGTVLLVVPMGEPHRLGADLKAATLRAAGWSVAKRDHPSPAALSAAIESVAPDAVVLTTSRVFSRPHSVSVLADLTETARLSAAQADLAIFLGGRGWGNVPLAQIGVDALSPGAAHLPGALKSHLELVSTHRRQPPT